MRRFLKVVVGVVASVIALAVIGLGVLYGVSSYQQRKQYALAAPAAVVSTDSVSIAIGKHLIGPIGKCGYCHGDDLGGKVVVENPALGRIYAPNITSGNGGVSALSDAELVRAIRQGLRPDGTSLTFMPSADYQAFSDADVAAVVAYLRHVPAVNRTAPGSSLGPIARMLVVTQKSPDLLPARFVEHRASVPSVAMGPTAEYGAYLIRVGGCAGCHTPALTGGPIAGGDPSWPQAANITREGLAKWSEADFTRALRTGLRPDNTVISAVMPWRYTRDMTDDEIRAVWLYIQSRPAATQVAKS